VPDKQYEVYVCACAAGSSVVYTRISMKKNALSELCGTFFCFDHYFNWKFETLFFCRGWIALNLFLNFEQKWASCSYKIILIKKCNMLIAYLKIKYLLSKAFDDVIDINIVFWHLENRLLTVIAFIIWEYFNLNSNRLSLFYWFSLQSLIPFTPKRIRIKRNNSYLSRITILIIWSPYSWLFTSLMWRCLR